MLKSNFLLRFTVKVHCVCNIRVARFYLVIFVTFANAPPEAILIQTSAITIAGIFCGDVSFGGERN